MPEIQLRDKIRKDLITTYLKKGFEGEEDLYFYVDQILGYTIPRQSMCPEHNPPWEFVWDVFSEKVRFCLAYGSRGSGKTLQIALLNHLRMLYRQTSVEVTLASATLDQSDKGYAHFLSFFNDPILGQLVNNTIKSKTRLFNGSELIITAGTYKGLNGAHSNTMCCDEIEVFGSYDLLGEALSISMSKRDKITQNVIPAQDIWSCITGDTLIDCINDSGITESIRIKDLVGKNFKINSWSHSLKKSITSNVKKVWKSRNDTEVYKLIFCYTTHYNDMKYENYRSIKATSNHLIMLENSNYKELGSLVVGDKLKSSLENCEKCEFFSKEFFGYEDVYDMEVENTQNFAVQGIFLHNSTRKFSSGIMTRVLSEAEEKNMSVYSFCVWEIIEKCTRLCKGDPNWGNCPIYDKCKGKAHDCNGWYSIPDFIQKVVSIPKSQFEAQWENKSPSGGAKVFASTWDENIHVLSNIDGGKFKSFYSIFHEKEIPRRWRRLGGMDFGSNFYFNLIAVEPKYDIWIVYFEYFYNQERLMSRHADEILKAPAVDRLYRVYGDPSAKQGILEMNALLKKRLRRDVIIPAMNDLLEGVDAVKKRLEINVNTGLPSLFVMDSCIELRREFREWEHEMLPDGKPDLDSFEDGNDHGLDSTRYEIFSYPRMPRPSYRMMAVDGI